MSYKATETVSKFKAIAVASYFIVLPTCEEYKVVPVTPDEKVVAILGDKTSNYNEALSDYVDGVMHGLQWDAIVGTGDKGLYDPDPDTLTFTEVMDNYTSQVQDNLYECVGNHCIDDLDNIDDWLSFFGHSNGYYKQSIGFADFFFLDIYLKEDESGYYTILETFTRTEASFKNSTQGQWLIAQLAASKAAHKIVVFHAPPISSATNGYKIPFMQWDWVSYGVNTILCGHFHWYERLIDTSQASGNVNYLTVGAGGAGNISPKTPDQYSIIQVCAGNETDAIRGSILLLDIRANTITGELVGVGLTGQTNRNLDTFTINKI